MLHFTYEHKKNGLECPTGILEAMGSTPVRDSEFVICSTLMTNKHIIFIIIFTELKIYHLHYLSHIINRWPVSSVGRASDCHAGGRGFKPRPDQQMVKCSSLLGQGP